MNFPNKQLCSDANGNSKLLIHFNITTHLSLPKKELIVKNAISTPQFSGPVLREISFLIDFQNTRLEIRSLNAGKLAVGKLNPLEYKGIPRIPGAQK